MMTGDDRPDREGTGREREGPPTHPRKEIGSEKLGADSKIGIGIWYMAETNFAVLRNTGARLWLQVD